MHTYIPNGNLWTILELKHFHNPLVHGHFQYHQSSYTRQNEKAMTKLSCVAANIILHFQDNPPKAIQLWKMESCIIRYLIGHFYISGIVNLIIHMTKPNKLHGYRLCIYITISFTSLRFLHFRYRQSNYTYDQTKQVIWIYLVYISYDILHNVQIGNKFDIYIRQHAFVFLQLYSLYLNPYYIYHINSI